jgi:NodT family efflux transporter outer membrane factor (OMF) lipoprotein
MSSPMPKPMSRSANALVACAVSVMLSGCAVGPTYQRPLIAAPQTFMGSAAVASRAAPQLAATTSMEWWDGFDDPLMTRLIREALDQNLDLAQSVARVSQARASLQSATAALLPSGTVDGSALRQRFSLETPVGQVLRAQPGADRTVNTFEAALGASWEIDLAGGLRRGRESAGAFYQAARIDVAAARLSVAAETADTYVATRGLQARIAIASQQIDKQRQLLATVQLQFSKGVAAALQVEQAEGLLAQVEATLPALAIQLDAAMNALDVLLGAQPGAHRAELAAVAPVPTAPGIATAMGPADLIRRRPDLVVAERQLQASNARIGVALAEYYPKFSFSGLIGSATTQTGNLFTGNASQWQGVLGLRWRLFDFARVDAEVSAARGRNAEQLAAYRRSVLRATEDVENAFSALVNSEIQEEKLARGEMSLTKARDSSVAAYKGGVVSLIEVLDADTRLLSTRDARARAQTEAARAAIASYRALGGGWDAAEADRTAGLGLAVHKLPDL